jgi:cytoskeletal protein CcmA (bactofilin family)
MFNKSKTNSTNLNADNSEDNNVELDAQLESQSLAPAQNMSAAPVAAPITAPTPQRSGMMDIISASSSSKPSILSEGFSFRGEIAAKGAIHVEGSLNGQIQVDELTIGARGQVDGVVTCSSLHIKGKFSGTATCSELIVTSSASVDGHVVYRTLSVQKGASIKGELLLVK